MMGAMAQRQRKQRGLKPARVVTALLTGTVLTAAMLPAAANAQVAPGAGITREELQRDQLDQQLQSPGQALSLDSAVERAPCPLAGPQFADLSFTFTGAHFTGLESIDASMVAPAYTGVIGQELPVSAICDIRDRAATILRQAGFLAAVQVPVQEIADGAVRFDVVLARMSAVQVRGDAGPSGRLLQQYINRLVGQPVFNVDDAERYLLLARDIPGLDVRLVLQAAPRDEGALPGDVVGIFNVSRTSIVADVNIQNLGSRAVGRFGALARVRLNGITGMGDETTLSYYVTEDFSEQQVLQLGHEFRVGGEGLQFGGNLTFAWSQPDIPGPNLFASETFIGSAYASYPFRRRQTSNVSGTLGFDLIDQDVEFTGLPLSRDRLRVAYMRFDFSQIDAGSLRGSGGYSAAEPRFFAGASIEVRQGLDVFGTSEACGPAFVNCTVPGVVPPSRLDGDPTAFVVRGQGLLDYRPVPLLKLSMKPRFQYSPDALLGYEQISGGNYTAGRGFDPGAVIGDSGYGGQVEMAYGSLIPQTVGGMAFQPYAFFDVMAVNSRNLPGTQTISSAGGGIRAALGQTAFLDIVGAVPLQRAPFQASRGDARVLINLSVQFGSQRR